MTVDYERIRQENKTEYGTAIGRIGKLFFRDTYADRTHFIFELLQNAEDAIARRAKDKEQPRSISFELTEECLRVSHFGDPFNEYDVSGICGIDESTKENSLTSIGRFGIGFKSVYAFTDRPEIHSGSEHFAIESFVWPEAVQPIDQNPDETVFLIPFKSIEESGYNEIIDGLRKLGGQPLLFLREIDEVKWNIQTGESGHYLRECKDVDDNVRHITLLGQIDREEATHEEWLTFSRQVFENDHTPAGHVEIAFSLNSRAQRQRSIQAISESPLVVFFPTSRETRLGFLIQGPYQTTLSRDNIPADEPWNKHLIKETAELLKDSLRWLRDNNELDTNVLRCLPISSANFNMGMFDALFEATRDCLLSEPLLPRLGGGYVSASNAILGRGDALRRLFSDDQLKALYPTKSNPSWLTSDITTDRAPRLRNYLMHHLNVEEPTPAAIIRKCHRAFLKDQSDEWIQVLYEFLNDSPRLLKPQSGYRLPYTQNHQLYDVPLVRLEDGRHIAAEDNGQVQAFLPTDVATEFPTVRAATCATPEARAFLKALGLREPDLIDDVIDNVLPRYEQGHTEVMANQYESDIARILRAFSDSDSSKQRQRLVDHLRTTPLVMTSDIGGRCKRRARPDEVYLRAHQLLSLFSGVTGVRFVDGDVECLAGDHIQRLLQRCGSAVSLRPVQSSTTTFEKYPDIIREHSTRGQHIEDCNLYGLDLLLHTLPHFDAKERASRANLIWQALAEVGQENYSGSYHWFYYSPQSTSFDAQFVKLLNEVEWIPDSAGHLCSPSSICFDDLGWQENTFLQSKVIFKPPAVDREAARLLKLMGIADDVVEQLKRLAPDDLSELLRSALQRASNSSRARKRRRIGGDSESSDEEVIGQVDSPTRKFSDLLIQAMTPDRPYASYKETFLPHVGANTVESAVRDALQSIEKGRIGDYEVRETRRFVLSKAAKEISQNIKEMLHGDYGKRCQICGSTFVTRAGEVQVFSDHVVDPASDSRTNHFGNLLSLCGWHYALISYGQWVFVNPTTNDPVEGTDDLETLLNYTVEESSDDGSSYIPVEIKFWNVYRDWRSEPEAIEERIRFSGPHWTYLCQLLEN